MITPYDRLRMGSNVTADDAASIDRICARIPGYSGGRHYSFFKMLLGVPELSSLLLLGVYKGRDIAFILDVLHRYHQGRHFRIVGIDKFNDEPCADWPAGTSGKNWEQAGFGSAPSIEEARTNIHDAASPEFVTVELHKCDDADYLAVTDDRFDALYLDTAHDEATVARQLAQVARVCHPGAVIAGDDYSNEGTWGVKRAVEKNFAIHHVYADWIWFSSLEKLKPATV